MIASVLAPATRVLRKACGDGRDSGGREAEVVLRRLRVAGRRKNVLLFLDGNENIDEILCVDGTAGELLFVCVQVL